MSRLWKKLAGLFSNKTLTGVDKAGNHYFTRTELIDGIMKEKRSVVFKGEQESTSIPVEWICWLNGQRKIAPTAEEMAELEARRERVRQNVARLKKEEEEERKAKEGASQKPVHTDKVSGPDLKSFIQQYPVSSDGEETREVADTKSTSPKPMPTEKRTPFQDPRKHPESSEPVGSGESFKPGTWQPPS